MSKIEIDRSLCSGFGLRVELAPVVIALVRGGGASVRRDSTAEPLVSEAAEGCRAAAVTVHEEAAV